MMEARVAALANLNPTDPIPWSIVDIGYSYRAEKRKVDHYSHSGKNHVAKK